MTKVSTRIKLLLRSILLKAGSIETDKGFILFDGEELKVGDEVFVENAEGEIVPAEDGEYKVEGKTYVIEEGKVARIDEEEKVEETIEETIEAEEETPAPADEPEVEETETEEDRIARLEESVAEIREGIEELTNAIAAVAKRLEAVEEKISGLEEPAAEPAEEGEETEEKFTSKMAYLRKK